MTKTNEGRGDNQGCYREGRRGATNRVTRREVVDGQMGGGGVVTRGRGETRG